MTKELLYSFDPRTGRIKPEMINGTGNIYQMTMWLDAGNKYRDGEKAVPRLHDSTTWLLLAT